VYLETYRRDSYFTWKPEDDAAYYTFLLSQQEDLSSPLMRKQERDNYCAFNVRDAGLAPGQYYWGVFQTDMEGNNSALSQAQTLVVMAGAPPEPAARAEIAPRPAVPAVPEPEQAAPEPAAASAAPAAAAPPEPAARAESAPRPAVPAVPAPERAAPATPAAAAPPGRAARAEIAPQPAVPAVPAPERAAPEPAAAPAIPAPVVPAAAAPPPAALQPLPAPRNLRPAEGYTLTEEIILRDRSVAFSWEQVPGAAGYTFVLYQNEGGIRREILRRTALRTPSFTLTDLTVLDAGEFVWQIEAEGDSAGRRSEAATNRFRVSLGEIEAAESRESGVMFGRD
jgi:hypothetical protein